MDAEAPPVDQSNGKYDEFETLLSKKLGLKVILVRGWETPWDYHSAHSACFGCRTQEELDAARAKFKVIEEATIASLRANITDRDREVGHTLTPNELRSLLSVSHVTKKESNADPEQAVIIFDPRESPLRTERDVALEKILVIPRFRNQWKDDIPFEEGSRIDARDVIENFDIAEEDCLRYQALKKVIHALQNQNEYNNKSGHFNEPFFYRIAGLNDNIKQMWQHGSPWDIPEKMGSSMLLDLYDQPEDYGIQDPKFFEKLKLASAIRQLDSSFLSEPHEIFARLNLHLIGQEIYDIQTRQKERLKKYLEKRLPKDHYFSCMSRDPRILFPIFREIYERDKSKGPERKYLDTIWEGLQKWFPTITNAPVPKVDGPEPPRKVDQMTQPANQQQSRKPTLSKLLKHFPGRSQ